MDQCLEAQVGSVQQLQSFTLDFQSAKDVAVAVIHFTLSFVHRNYCSSACPVLSF